jgi:hypothetical protein
VKRAPHPVYSPDLSSCVVHFFGYAKNGMKYQAITSEDHLEDKWIKVYETLSGDRLESVFDEWISKVEWVIEHAREYSMNAH